MLAEVCRFSNTAGLRRHGALVSLMEQVDPLAWITSLVTSSYHWTGGRFEVSVEPARRACERAAPASMVPLMAGGQLAVAGRTDEAMEVLGRAAALLQGTPLGREASFMWHALRGDRAAALAFAPALDGVVQNEFAAIFTADSYARLGLLDEALTWVRKAVSHGFINYPFLAEHDPFLDDLRGTAGFSALLDEVRPRWESVVAWEESRTP